MQLKYTNIIYISQEFFSNYNDLIKISENIQNFCGYNNIKNIKLNSYPNNFEEYNIYMHNIYTIISEYLNNSYESKGLYIYVKNEYLSFFEKIRLICNLYNYELTIIDETSEAKNNLLDKISEVTKTQRLPSIPEQIDYQLSLVEELMNNYEYKWNIFINNNNINSFNGVKNTEEINNIVINNNNDIKTISLLSETESIIDLNSLSVSDINNKIEILDENSINNYKFPINQNNINNNDIHSTNEKLVNINTDKEKQDLLKINDIKNNTNNHCFNIKELYNKLQNNIYSFCHKEKNSYINYGFI